MAGATATVVGDKQILAVLKKLEQLGLRTRPLMLEIGEEMIQSTDQRFDKQQSPSGKSWAQLSEGWLSSRRKTRSKGAGKILQLDRVMRSTLAYQATDGDVRWGTSRIYGATHQFGDAARGIAQREWLGMSKDDKALVLKIAWQYLADGSGATLTD